MALPQHFPALQHRFAAAQRLLRSPGPWAASAGSKLLACIIALLGLAVVIPRSSAQAVLSARGPIPSKSLSSAKIAPAASASTGESMLSTPPGAQASVNPATAFGISAPLAELSRLPQSIQAYDSRAGLILSVQKSQSGQGLAVDPVEQSYAGGEANFSIGTNIPGIAASILNPANSLISGTEIAVGDTQIIQSANMLFKVFAKNGTALSATLNGNILWEYGIPGSSCASLAGQVSVHWDRLAHRWLITSNTLQSPYAVCIAISASPDALGSYYLYQFPVPGNGWPDYPKWGVWPTGYFQAQNNFGSDGLHFNGPQVCAYNSAKLLAGDETAEQVCVQLTTHEDSLLPADVDSPGPPPAGEDELFIGSVGDVDNSHLSLYSFHVDFATPDSSFVTGAGNAQLIAVPTYNSACNEPGNGGACIAQAGSAGKLNSLGARLIDRLVYWNDGTTQHWLCNHDAQVSGGNVGVRWYEFTAPEQAISATGLTLSQSGTFAPDSNSRWMGSIARDAAGNILLGYSEAGNDLPVSSFLAGRAPKNAPGTLENEMPAVSGAGAAAGKRPPMGAVRVDPGDNCTFWYAAEYEAASSAAQATRISSAKFLNCSSATSTSGTQSPSLTGDLHIHRDQQDTLYSNLGPPGDLYNCCNGWTVAGTGGFGTSFTAANEFQVRGSGDVSQLDIAIGLISGTNAFYVAIYDDQGGLPHSQLPGARWDNLEAGNSFGGCCGLITITGISGIHLVSGTTYWMVVGPETLASDTWGSWNLNNQGVTSKNVFSNDGGSTWVSNGIQTTGAFDLLGTLTGLPSTTVVSSSKNPSNFGEAVTFTASVTGSAGTPTGTVTFTANGNPIPECPSPVNLTNGSAQCATHSLPEGSDLIRASYSGDNTYDPSSGTLTQRVEVPTTTTVTTSRNPSNINDLVTFTAIVDGTAGCSGDFQPFPSGTVAFADNGTTIPGCASAALTPTNMACISSATCSTQSLAAGTHVITTTYLGDGFFGPSNGTLNPPQTVNKGNSNTVLQSTKNPANVNDSVTFIATVTAVNPGPLSPTGTVAFTSNGNSIPECPPVALVNGVASCTTQSLPAGQDVIGASYSGDNNFNPSNNQLTETVNQGTSQTVLQSSRNPSNLNDLVTFTATVTAVNPGRLSPTGSVTFTSNGNPMPGCTAPVNLVGGVASCATQSLPMGSDLIRASYGGDHNFTASSGQLTQTVNSSLTVTCGALSLTPTPSMPANTFTAMVTCVDSQGEALTTTMDWGDGTHTTMPSGVFNASHTYTVPGTGNLPGNNNYQLTVVATDTSGQQGMSQGILELTIFGSVSVFPGQSASITNTLFAGSTPVPQNVTFMCTDVKDTNGNLIPASTLGISCSSVPSPLTLQMSQQQVTVLIQTNGQATGTVTAGMKYGMLIYALWLAPWPIAFVCLGPGLGRRGRGGRYRHRKIVALGAIVLVLFLFTSCGSGGFTPPQTQSPATTGTPPGTYDVTIVDQSSPPGATGFVQTSLVVQLTVEQFQH